MAIQFFDVATVASRNTQYPGHQIIRDFSGTLYVCVENSASPFKADIYTSTDGGATWSLNAWDTAVGNTATSASHSQMLLDRLNNTVYLCRLDTGTGEKSFSLWRRDPAAETWVDHGAILASSATAKSDIGRPTLIMDYGARIAIGSPLITVSLIHFVHFRDRTDPNRYLYRNTFGNPEELIDNEVPEGSNENTIIPALLPSGIMTLAAWKNEPVVQDHIDFYFRLGSVTQAGTWVRESTVVSTSSYTGQRLHDHIVTLQGETKILFTANSDLVYIGERFGAGLWTVDQITDGTNTPTMHSSGSFYGLLTADWNGDLYATFATGAGVMESWRRRRSSGEWTREVSLTSISISAGLDRMYDNRYNRGENVDEVMVPGDGTFGTLWVSGTLKWFEAGGAAFTPEPEDEYECPTEPTRSSVVLPGEGASGGTFPASLRPDFTYAEDDGFFTNEFRSDLGYTQTVARFATGRRKITVRFDALSETDKDTIQTFLNARQHQEAFTWTLPDSSTTIKVALVAPSVEYRKRAPDVYAVSFELMELLT